jgi:bifunctional non-homologous end joining protein LigD
MPSRKPRHYADNLKSYRDKRSASTTPEPFRGTPATGAAAGTGIFVVQQHRARHLHFDLRLEMDGVLRSWAVPKGPSANPSDKRFAALVEDHPLDYADFEGRIPAGNYGAGYVIVWDRGTYKALEDMADGIERGKLLFELDGYKLRGRWTLVRMKKANEWLLIKERDAFAVDGTEDARASLPQDSIYSGLTIEQAAHPEHAKARLQKSLSRAKLPPVSNRDISPMLASSGEPFDRAGWLFEFKYDGYRLMARRRGTQLRLSSRNGHDLTDRFPELELALRTLPFDAFTIDGEVVVLDHSGRPDFGGLVERINLPTRAAVEQAARRHGCTLYAFDLIDALGFDTSQQPLTKRKTWLADMLPTTGPVRYSEHIERFGRRAFAGAQELGLEGVVGKRGASPYRPGRSKDWIKVRTEKTGDFVIAGFTKARSGHGLGAIAVAEFRAGVLCYAGRVGTGLSGAQRSALETELTALTPGKPLTDDTAIRWVQPALVCEVSYREITRAGHLRHPVFIRLRADKAPHECVARGGDPVAIALAPAEVEVSITHSDKVFFPELGLTKGDLVGYYDAIAPWMLPYLADRPVVLTRFPDGIHGKSFYQRDAPAYVPDWIRRETLWSEGAEREVRYFVIESASALRYIANMGAIPIHTWHSRVASLERPDWCVLDLDPKSAPFSAVIEVARAVRTLTEEIELPAFIKTSGASGLHILLPLATQLTHDQSRTLAELLARVVVARLPAVATINRIVRTRKRRVYIDYLQNGHGRLLVAPFSARAEPAASVSMPIRFPELGARLSNDRFHIKNAVTRMRRLDNDPLADLLTVAPELPRSLELLSKIARATI